VFPRTAMFRFHETPPPPLIHPAPTVDTYVRNREDTLMPRIENACPFDAATRAARCSSCTVANASMPPCVVAFLSEGASLAQNLIPLRRAEAPALRRAA
jgi:hypothetical protein